jgi:hypothetical protein
MAFEYVPFGHTSGIPVEPNYPIHPPGTSWSPQPFPSHDPVESSNWNMLEELAEWFSHVSLAETKKPYRENKKTYREDVVESFLHSWTVDDRDVAAYVSLSLKPTSFDRKILISSLLSAVVNTSIFSIGSGNYT